MKISPGDEYTVRFNNEDVPVRAVYTPDGGLSWLCNRVDRPLTETAIMLTATELTQDLAEEAPPA